MFKTKAAIVVAGLAGTLAASKHARDVTRAVGRYVAERGVPAAVAALDHLRAPGAVLATDAGLPVLDLTQGFAAAVDRGILPHVADDWVGRQMRVRIPSTPAAAAPVRVATITAPTEIIDLKDTAPEGWEVALGRVEEGLDAGAGWREPNFAQPTYRELESGDGARRWAAVPGPISPPHGTGSVPVASGDHLGVIVPPVVVLPDPHPVGAAIPVAKGAPWKEVELRRHRRFRASAWTWRQEAAIRRLHASWRTDEGRAAVHIANDPVGLHDELCRQGRIGEWWQQRGRTTGGFWSNVRSRMTGFTGSDQRTSLLDASDPSSFDDGG